MSYALTDFKQTEAILMATEDAEVDSGVYIVDDYLTKHFSKEELKELEKAADVLSYRCRNIRWDKYKT